MREFHLNFDGTETRPELHNKIADEFSFPEWYGKNLDALHDCLSDISENTLITIEHFQLLEDNMGRYAIALKKVFTDISNENNFITIKFI